MCLLMLVSEVEPLNLGAYPRNREAGRYQAEKQVAAKTQPFLHLCTCVLQTSKSGSERSSAERCPLQEAIVQMQVRTPARGVQALSPASPFS